MRLRYSPTSPYVRKVTVCARETGQFERLELVATDPWDESSDLGEINPLHQVPVLILDDGRVLYDSPVVCEYLAAQVQTPRLYPDGEARWEALRGQALADGLLDAAVALFVELRRLEPHERSGWWEGLQLTTIDRALNALDRDAVHFGADPDIAQIAAGCALGYLDFRFPEIDWRAGRSALRRWFERFAERPSMRATLPKAPDAPA